MTEHTPAFKIPWHSSLVFRSMLSIFLLLSIIIGAASYISISNQKKEHATELDNEATYISRITTQAVAMPLWNIDNAQVQQQLASLRGSKSICGARVLDSRGYEFANSGYPKNLSPSQKAYSQDILYDNPQVSGNNMENIGKLELCISNTELEAKLDVAIKIQLIFFSMITVAVLGAYYASLMILVAPLLHIRHAMEELATTMKPIRDPALTKENEIGALSNSFNKMVISLSKTYNALKISREKAVKADHSKTEFLANMSHELRTPLNIIIGMTQIMEHDDIPKEFRESFSLINRSSNTLLAIVNDILDLTKIEAGEMRLENITFALGAKIDHVAKAMESLAGQKGLSLTCENWTGGHIVMGDPLRFERVLVNLIGNAIRYTEKGGITVRAAIKETNFNQIRFTCEIIDTGIGIPEDKIDKIFDKFSQADTSTTRKYGGTGLGLTITKQLVEMMGGKIGVESKEGDGTTFWIQIPFVLSDKIIESVPSTPQKGHEDYLVTKVDAANARILLAEDNEINRAFMTKLLRSHGIARIHCVDNGADAVEEIKNRSYDLILMDCNMPKMSGYDAASAIRALPDPEQSTIPIIALTANAMPEDREKCLALGINGYLSKPFRLEEFVDTLSAWIRLDKAA